MEIEEIEREYRLGKRGKRDTGIISFTLGELIQETQSELH